MYDLHFTLESPGYKSVDFGYSEPISHQSHKITPLCSVSGSYSDEKGDVHKNIRGHGTFIHALFTHQRFTDLGKSWNNFRFYCEDYTVHMLQYVPRGSSSPRTQSSISHGSEILGIGTGEDALNVCEDIGERYDDQTHYTIPTALKYNWRVYHPSTGKCITASCQVDISGPPTSITDILNVFPGWAKRILAIWAGRPFVYNWCYTPTVLTLTFHDGRMLELKGLSFNEMTYVHDT